jgi:hypothetical protein
VSLVEGARLAVETGALGGKGAKELKALLEGLARWRSMMAGAVAAPSDDLIEDMGAGDQLSHIELAEVILDESGYTAHWQNDKTPEAPGRLENLKELIKALESFENLQGFLEHVSLIMDNEQEDGEPKVTLMTLHAAKGLEFPAVFLPGWEDGLFPSQRSMDESGPEGAGGGAAACLCRHHPGRGGLHDLLRRQPPGLWPMAKPDAVALHRRIAVGACGGADTARAFTVIRAAWRPQRARRRHDARVRPARTGGAGGCLQLARLETAAGQPGPVRNAAALGGEGNHHRRRGGQRVFHRATACSTRNSAMAPSSASRATSWA